MSPYMQNVVDIQKRESMRDYAKQLNQLKSQAVGAKAYGGSRLAIEQAEAARNQAQRLGDIEAQGLQQAYQSGMGQFSAEQGLGLQAGQANLSAAQQTALANQAATNQQRQQYVSNALQAAMQAYGGQLTAAQQNQIAANAASQFNAQAQNTAYNNYAAQQLAAQQANQAMDWNTVSLNTQNQQAAAQANQNAINQQRSQYVTQALQAAQTNYGGQLTAAQQNQIAQNAAAQFNAQNQQQASLANQQAGLTTEQQNAQLAQQAAIQNQNAGLQGNQQNIGALSAMGGLAQGLGGLGSTVGNYNANLAGMFGQAGATLQGLGQGWYNQQQQNAANIFGGPTTLANQGISTLAGMGAGQSGVNATTQKVGG